VNRTPDVIIRVRPDGIGSPAHDQTGRLSRQRRTGSRAYVHLWVVGFPIDNSLTEVVDAVEPTEAKKVNLVLQQVPLWFAAFMLQRMGGLSV
jgi:hypothetical protein